MTTTPLPQAQQQQQGPEMRLRLEPRVLVGEGHRSAWHVRVPIIVYRPISLKHHDVEILITRSEINNKRSFGPVARPI